MMVLVILLPTLTLSLRAVADVLFDIPLSVLLT